MAELDDAYAIMAHTPGGERLPSLWADRAAAMRTRLNAAGRAELGIRYGQTPRQYFDLFLPEAGTQSGVSIFVHGGYWRAFDPSSWSHLAEGALARGWAVAMPGYDLCPAVRISDITRQVAVAVRKIADKVPGPIALSGHSAGGHLVSRMLAPGMLPDPVVQRFTHVVPISPLADLRPLLRTSMNDDFGMDLAAAEAESPVLQRPPDVPVTVWVGGDERPALLDQAEWLARAWGCGHVVVSGKHHFDVIDALGDPESDLVRRLTG